MCRIFWSSSKTRELAIGYHGHFTDAETEAYRLVTTESMSAYRIPCTITKNIKGREKKASAFTKHKLVSQQHFRKPLSFLNFLSYSSNLKKECTLPNPFRLHHSLLSYTFLLLHINNPCLASCRYLLLGPQAQNSSRGSAQTILLL